jgi:hypothetical protein
VPEAVHPVDSNAVVLVVAGDDVALADLLGPPAQLGHAVLDGADGQAFGLPARHQAGKRIAALAWRPVVHAMADKSLAFDHAALVSRAVETTRAEVEQLDLPAGFLSEQFTLGELQACCEQLLGRRLDKSSFRRRLSDRELVEPVEGEMRTGANRPAQVYRLRKT